MADCRVPFVILGILFFCLLSLSSLAQEQETSLTKQYGDLLESIASNTEQTVDASTLVDRLQELEQQPVAINSASLELLQKLIMLNDFQVRSLYNYIQEKGRILSPYELTFVYGFDREVVQQILPFITLNTDEKENRLPLDKSLKYGKHQIFLRLQRVLEKQQGYRSVSDSLLALHPNSIYQGTPWRFYTRYGFSFQDRLAFGFTAEKDPGEPFFKSPNKQGFDFYSAFFQLKNTGLLKNLVVGDYEPRFGQGLTIWSGLNYGKSSTVLLTEKRENEIRKYSSTNENKFFRGAAATVKLGKNELSVFVSSKRIDATPDDADSTGSSLLSFSGIDDTGLHSTLSELAKRDALRENMAGANFNLKRDKFRVGTSFLYYKFDGLLNKGEALYDLYDFSGTSGMKMGADYKWYCHSLYLFGEAAFQPGHGLAILQGGSVPLTEQAMFTFLYRNYSRDFFPYYSNGFGERSHTQNEHGLYAGAVIKPLMHWKISAYIDLFSFPWLLYNTNAPSYGRDFFIQADFNPLENLEFTGRFQKEVKEENIESTSAMSKTGLRQLTRLRFQISYNALPSLILRNRIEGVGYQKEDREEQGILLYQDILYRPARGPVDIGFRFAIFDADSWDTRIYAYENDVLYAFSVPAYYGKGTRMYLLLHAKLGRRIDLWGKISRTDFSDRETNGSGLNTIETPHKTEIKLQARLKF